MARLVLFIFLIASCSVQAQNVTIINNYNGEGEDMSSEDFVLKSVTEHTYIVNEYEPSNTGERSKVQQMISYGLRSHIDNQFHIFDSHVQILENPVDFVLACEAIVQNAIWIHDLTFYDSFSGFSPEVGQLVQDLQKSDGYKILGGDRNRAAAGNSQIGLYTFQRTVYELKIRLEDDVNAFLDEQMPRMNQEFIGGTPDAPYLIDTNYQLDSFDENDKNLLEIEPLVVVEEKKPRGKKKKQQAEENNQSLQFSERIVELLEENNRILANYDNRFEDIQSQIDEIKEDRETEQSDELKSEIAELRQMIIDLSQGGTIREPDGSVTSISSQSVTIIFEKNAYELSMAQQAQLNVAVRELQNNPRTTALITGYADKTGNAEYNAWISKARADSVRDYLLASGVSDQRLILNFLGDAESIDANPADRKVEVQFLQNTSSL